MSMIIVSVRFLIMSDKTEYKVIWEKTDKFNGSNYIVEFEKIYDGIWMPYGKKIAVEKMPTINNSIHLLELELEKSSL